MEHLRIKKYDIGTGRPLMCVPVVEIGQNDIFMAAKCAVDQGAEALEWRMDWFGKIDSWEETEAVLHSLSGICKETILLCTFRSKVQGGQRALPGKEYQLLLERIAESKLADLLDVEVFELSDASAVIAKLHRAGQRVIGSQHYFSHTPDTVWMRQELETMKEAGADIGKLAVMPKESLHVLQLLEASAQMKKYYPDYPIVTMAMGGLGAISRVSGQVFGSCITFASIGKASAPGQLSIKDTKLILNKISESMDK